MTDNVVNFTGVTSLDIDPTRVLKTASDQEFDSIIIVGYTKDGEEYFASSISDGADVLWHLERAKLRLLRMVD